MTAPDRDALGRVTPVTLENVYPSHITPASVWRMQRTQAGVVYWKRVPSDSDPVCSFCGKRKSNGNRRFIAGPASVYICEDCVDLCAEILEEEREA